MLLQIHIGREKELNEVHVDSVKYKEANNIQTTR